MLKIWLGFLLVLSLFGSPLAQAITLNEPRGPHMPDEPKFPPDEVFLQEPPLSQCAVAVAIARDRIKLYSDFIRAREMQGRGEGFFKPHGRMFESEGTGTRFVIWDLNLVNLALERGSALAQDLSDAFLEHPAFGPDRRSEAAAYSIKQAHRGVAAAIAHWLPPKISKRYLDRDFTKAFDVGFLPTARQLLRLQLYLEVIMDQWSDVSLDKADPDRLVAETKSHFNYLAKSGLQNIFPYDGQKAFGDFSFLGLPRTLRKLSFLDAREKIALAKLSPGLRSTLERFVDMLEEREFDEAPFILDAVIGLNSQYHSLRSL